MHRGTSESMGMTYNCLQVHQGSTWRMEMAHNILMVHPDIMRMANINCLEVLRRIIGMAHKSQELPQIYVEKVLSEGDWEAHLMVGLPIIMIILMTHNSLLMLLVTCWAWASVFITGKHTEWCLWALHGRRSVLDDLSYHGGCDLPYGSMIVSHRGGYFDIISCIYQAISNLPAMKHRRDAV